MKIASFISDWNNFVSSAEFGELELADELEKFLGWKLSFISFQELNIISELFTKTT